MNRDKAWLELGVWDGLFACSLSGLRGHRCLESSRRTGPTTRPWSRAPYVYTESGYHGWRTEHHICYAACLGVEDDGMARDEKRGRDLMGDNWSSVVDSSSKYNTVDPP